MQSSQSSRRQFLRDSFVLAAATIAAQRGTALADRVQDAALHGKFERYKTTSIFDSTAKHAKWLGDSAS